MTDTATTLDPPRRFLRPIDWSAFWTATLLSLAVYVVTAAPSVTLEDSGEFIVAADHLGVPHPPGYPIWTLCGWVFARLFHFVTFRGHPNPAWALAILSGVFGALAIGLTAMLITRTATDMLRTQEDARPAGDGRRARRLACWTGGVAGSLTFAFSNVMWSQSTIVEVYTLNAFFLALLFVLTYRWMRRPSDRVLWLAAFVFGLGLTNYQVLLLAALPLMVVLLLKDLPLFRDFTLLGIPFLLLALILKITGEEPRPGLPRHIPPEPWRDLLGPPLVAPQWYILIAVALALVLGGCVAMAASERRRARAPDEPSPPVAAAGVLAVGSLLLLALLLLLPSAPPAEPAVGLEAFSWTLPALLFVALLGLLWALAWHVPGGRWYALGASAVPVALLLLLAKGALMGLTHPLTGWFWAYGLVNVVFLALAAGTLPRGRTVATTAALAQLGVAFYLYMPLASDRNPPMNWGYARTWEGFLHALSRGQYEQLAPANAFSAQFIRQLGGYFTDLRTQFTLLLVPLGFIPFSIWQFRLRGRRVRGFVIALAFAAVVALLTVVERLWEPAVTNLPRIDKLAIAVILALSAIGGLTMVLLECRGLHDAAMDRERPPSERIAAALFLLGAGLLAALVAVGLCNAAAEFLLESRGVLTPGPDASRAARQAHLVRNVALTALFAAVVAAFTVLLAAVVLKRRADFHLPIDRTASQWLLATIAGFLMMSLVLVALANPTGDVQESFIHKVKFISSHGLFAIWIGYGIAFALTTLASRLGSGVLHRAIWRTALAGALLTPLIPIYENYHNDAMINVMSAANQDGHDFGWQFGNYSLRGIEAIRAELADDEEPPPNPEYPPAMGPNAIFFGGTDPGRFVPTYMIYSAKVRPDVFLITQNALADHTYLNAMRDLYGDRIWMPTPKDNSIAFSRYVREIESGKRRDQGQISFVGGRVQVTGALAVMEINSMLTEQIFRKNIDRHPFYVEESYAIPWMYPHLSPHGLILEIERERSELTPRRIADDMDFWDWYGRRLLANPRYHRDLPARKAFSKLRGAIGGLYAARGQFGLAERAYRESRLLYPYSPEMLFRLVQEVLLPYRRFEDSIDLLEGLQRADPLNDRIPAILEHIRQAHGISRRLERLQALQVERGFLHPQETLDLAHCYLQLGRGDRVPALITPLLEAPDLAPDELFVLGALFHRAKQPAHAADALDRIPPERLDDVAPDAEALLSLASIYASAGRHESVARILLHHLGRDPRDWQAWLDLATMSLRIDQRGQALQALRRAVEIGGSEAVELIQRSRELNSFFQDVLSERARRSGPARGGAPR